MFEHLKESLESYLLRYPEESALVSRFTGLLKLPDAFVRTCRPGHFTASALVLSLEKHRVLLVKHRKLGIWVQPGGHAEGDTNLGRAALREVEEETGLAVREGDLSILDLDIHPIPARPGEGPHDHYDVRFLFFADSSGNLTISDESTDLKWVDIEDVDKYTREESLLRMLKKAGIGSQG